MGEGLLVFDPDGRVVLVNGAAERIIGLSRLDLLGKPWPEQSALPGGPGIVDAGGRPLPLDQLPIERAFRRRRRESRTNFSYRRANGTTVPIGISASPILEGRTHTGTVVILRDVTQERLMDRAKTEFVSIASHQLRTPIGIMKWYAESLLAGEMGALTVEQHDYIQEIHRGSLRMARLVTALLYTSRLDLGTMSVSPQPTDLVRVARGALAELRGTILQKSITLREAYAKDLPKALVDPELFRIILSNLLSNAVKYTPARGQVTLSITQQAPNSLGNASTTHARQLLLMVEDTGMGIPKAQQQGIFQKMFRADNAREQDPNGTGLGLYIAKSILDQMNGRIWFTSVEGKGTTFFVMLPLQGADERGTVEMP